MVLNGWKEIAAHFNCSVRTVQRWERLKLGLPVHRPKQWSGPVCAFSEDLEDWLKRTPRRSLVETAQGELQKHTGFPYKVLLADHDEDLLRRHSEVLIKAGYEVRTARDGFEALAVMREGGVPDVLVADLTMPRMSGFELLSIVRKRFPGVGVIAFTGEFSPLNRPTILADAFVKKSPANGVDLLANKVRDVLSESPLRSQPSKSKEAVVWVTVPDNGYFVLTCSECLRSFSVPTSEAGSLASEKRTSCVHCGAVIRFRFDSASREVSSQNNLNVA